MVPEPVQRALRKLEGLLASTGVSPGIVAALGQAREHLRTVGGAGGVDADTAALQEAFRELEICLGYVRESSVAGDQGLAEDVAKLHRRIGRLLRPTGSAPPAASGPSPAGPAPGISPPEPGVATPPARDALAPWSQLAGGTTALPSLPPVPELPPARPSRPLPAIVEAPRWTPEVPAAPPFQAPPLVVPRSSTAVPAADVAPARTPAPPAVTDGEELAARDRLLDGIADRLLCVYRQRAGQLADPLLTWEALAPLDARFARPALAVGWLGDAAQGEVETRLREEAGGDARWICLPARAVPEELPAAPQLLAQVMDAEDARAIAAAAALAWIGTPAHAAELLLAATTADAPQRRAALLLAAVALGSPVALEAVREAVAAEEELDERLIDALAVAGDDADAARLLARATRGGPGLDAVALAIGHLGHAPSTLALSRLAGVDPRVVDAAMRATFGPDSARPAASGRLCQGRSWSVTAALARLAAPDEPVRSRARIALELAVRTGSRPPLRYDHRAPAARQAAAAKSFETAYAARTNQAPSGRWSFYGQPVPRFAVRR